MRTLRGFVPNVVAIQTPLTDAELAAFARAYTTAENLVACTMLEPGETVAIATATGDVGSAAIQLCRRQGARMRASALRDLARAQEAFPPRRMSATSS